MAAKKAKKAKKAAGVVDAGGVTPGGGDGHSMEIEVFDSEGDPTGETRVVVANEGALRAYARLHKIDIKGIDDVPGLVGAVIGSIEIRKGEDSYECTTCNTAVPAAVNDTFCPYCGADMTEDDTGGLEHWLDENKLVKVTDKTDKTDKDSTPEAEAGPEAGPEPGPEPSSEIAKIDPGAEADARSLDERVKNIVEIVVKLDNHSGEAAYDLGQELYRIKETELYDEAGFKTFRDFCEATRDKSGLGMTYANASNYIRIFSSPSITRELAATIGYTKAFTMANLLDDPRTAKPAAKMIEPDKEGSIPVVVLPTKAVQDRAKGIRAAARSKVGGKGASGAGRGRPSASKFKILLDTPTQTKIVELNPKEDGTLFPFDDKVAIEVVLTQGKDKKFRVKLMIVELAQE